MCNRQCNTWTFGIFRQKLVPESGLKLISNSVYLDMAEVLEASEIYGT